MKHLYFPLLIFAALQSCSPVSESNQADAGGKRDANDSLFVVKQGPFAFSLFLPKDLMINESPLIEYNQSSGDLHIGIGPEFELVFSAESSDMAALKASLADDGLFTNRVEKEENGCLVYQQFLPNGEPYYFHMAASANVGGENYVVRSSSMGEYTQGQIHRMVRAFESLKP